MFLHLFLLVALSLPSHASQEALRTKASSALLRELDSGKTADVLVRLAPLLDLEPPFPLQSKREKGRYVFEALRKHSLLTQESTLSALKRNGIEHRSFYIENLVQIPASKVDILRELAALPEVIGFDLNPTFRAHELPYQVPPSFPPFASDIPENIKAVGAEKVWNELRVKGEGIVIAGQDSGYFWQHPALKNQYRGFVGLGVNHNYSWHDAIHSGASGACPANSPEPCDDTGHGTHTMGSMVGYDGGANKIGVAPEAKWIGCRNMNRGAGTAATYLECFEFFLAPYPLGGDPKKDGRPDLSPHVINNSWACPSSEGCKGGEFLGAVRALKAAGIVVVVAVGNEGPGCASAGDPPGSYSGEVVTVAAFDHRSSEIASFSSRGPSKFNGGIGANLSGPGSAVRSAVPGGGISDSGYDYKSGTSMAAPHVAGVVALLWSAQPALIGNVAKTVELLEKTAKAKTSSQNCGAFPGSKVPNAVFGHGFIDAYSAIQGASR